MSVPTFDYGDIVYEGGNTIRLDELKSTQNRGLSVCCNIQVRISTHICNYISEDVQIFENTCFLQQGYVKYVINRPILTRANVATLYKTSIAILKNTIRVLYIVVYNFGIIYQLLKEALRHELYENQQYKWRKDVTNQ